MIDDQISRANRIDRVRVTTEFADGVTHGGEIDERWNAGKVLQDHSGRFEGDLDAFSVLLVELPVEDLLDIRLRDVESITVAHG